MIAEAKPRTGPRIAVPHDSLAKRSSGAELGVTLRSALTGCLLAGVEVVSVLPELITSQLVDKLVYNKRHNEVLFVKYLS